jgi:hypothetical protein
MNHHMHACVVLAGGAFFVISGGAMELIIIACLRRGGPQIAVHVWLLLS